MGGLYGVRWRTWRRRFQPARHGIAILTGSAVSAEQHPAPGAQRGHQRQPRAQRLTLRRRVGHLEVPARRGHPARRAHGHRAGRHQRHQSPGRNVRMRPGRTPDHRAATGRRPPVSGQVGPRTRIHGGRARHWPTRTTGAHCVPPTTAVTTCTPTTRATAAWPKPSPSPDCDDRPPIHGRRPGWDTRPHRVRRAVRSLREQGGTARRGVRTERGRRPGVTLSVISG